jgi:hypothetical protein
MKIYGAVLFWFKIYGISFLLNMKCPLETGMKFLEFESNRSQWFCFKLGNFALFNKSFAMFIILGANSILENDYSFG